MKGKETTNPSLSEKNFSQQVVDLAQLLGWKVYRTWISFHSPAGFPDLVLVRGDRLIMAELKSEKGQLTPAQEEWLEILRVTGKAEIYLWRPSDFEQIVGILQEVKDDREESLSGTRVNSRCLLGHIGTRVPNHSHY